ncbi:MAG: DUF302 domain-containing protein [Ectothiorhodospiraceae bacterium]|nr:DUF302 domain-containing protein [Ectothiorhodospiraceae bacterium]
MAIPHWRRGAFLVLITVLVTAAQAGAPDPEREGWRVIRTEQAYDELLDSLRAAVSAEGMGVVTDVGPTEMAARRGERIPGNRVVGVFRNDFAVRALRASVAAMIEAPIRFYVTETEDGTATLSWKTPSHVFAPYFDEGGDELRRIARELDETFEAIARRATGEQ